MTLGVIDRTCECECECESLCYGENDTPDCIFWQEFRLMPCSYVSFFTYLPDDSGSLRPSWILLVPRSTACSSGSIRDRSEYIVIFKLVSVYILAFLYHIEYAFTF